jgi:RNA polymerase sigma factor (sigma-70 family)
MSPLRRIAVLPGAVGDRALVARLRAGEEQAYRDCYDLHAPRIMALLVRILRDRPWAEEILQETFVAAFDKVSQYRAEARLSTWISGIGIRRALNALRDESRRIPRSRSVEESSGAGNESQLTSRDLARRILGLLETLSDEKRIALLLYAEGYTTSEIGTLTNVPRATVLARISRGRAELVALAVSEGISDESATLEELTRG